MEKNYIVESSTTLDRLLRSQARIQQWRIPILIRCNAVRVNKAAIPVNAVNMRLREGDEVAVRDPSPNAYVNALARIPAADYRDYAFVPGTTPFDQSMKDLIDMRPQTIRIAADAVVESVASFIGALRDSTKISNPVRHLLVASHANPEGHLSLRLSFAEAHEIEYEDLEKAVKDKSLLIDGRLLDPRPKDRAGAFITPLFLIRGCRVGRAVPFLIKLKEALGNRITVIAPKHFHEAAQQKKPHGFVEYMSYGFSIYSPTPLNYNQVVRAFIGRSFRRIRDRPEPGDGIIVPPREWLKWIPRDLKTQPMPTKVVSPITNLEETINGYFRHKPDRKLDDKKDPSLDLARDPGNYEDRKRVIRDELRRRYAYWRNTHPFPKYVRYGYRTMDEFMDGWKWIIHYDTSDHMLRFNAARHEYTVRRPIVDPRTNRLILNYYPSTRRGSKIENLDPGDPRFFSVA